MDVRAQQRCAPTDLLLRQDRSDRLFIPLRSVGTAKDDSRRGAHYAGQSPAYPGNILTKFLTLVFPSVRDTATTLETLCQLSAYQKNRFMVQQIHIMDG